jgi:hypothetical protein
VETRTWVSQDHSAPWGGHKEKHPRRRDPPAGALVRLGQARPQPPTPRRRPRLHSLCLCRRSTGLTTSVPVSGACPVRETRVSLVPSPTPTMASALILDAPMSKTLAHPCT